MTFDPNSLFNDDDEEIHIEPDRIFAGLIKNPEYGFLRNVQSEILTSWFEKRNEKDTILKMSTGAGKTLVGLLMLQSSLNEDIGQSIYLCPDYQLVDQVLKKSKEYGIKCVTFDNGNNNIPQEFINKEAILVTVFDKVFNGQSIFEKNRISVGTIVMDDAHSCIQKAREKFSIKLSIETDEYSKLLRIFENELKGQDVSTFKDIENRCEENYIMQVPYWTWISNIDTIAGILSEGAMKGKTDEKLLQLFFSWPLIKKYIESCYCFVSSEAIEITPHCLPINEIKMFKNAERRILMSATLLDDTLLIKELDVNKKSIMNPLKSSSFYNIGERMILIPSLFHKGLNNKEKIAQICKRLSEEKNNVVVLVSSFDERANKVWGNIGAVFANKVTINEKIDKLNTLEGQMVVFANRYDGIDLKDKQCRILVIDDLPRGVSYYDKFIDKVRSNSKIIGSTLAQKIEQGIGRSTRSPNDYSVILLLGDSLRTFVCFDEHLEYFSPQTRKQVEIGINFGKKATFSDENAEEVIYSIIKTSIDRNQNWLKYHNNQIQKGIDIPLEFIPIEIAEAERKAFELYNANRITEASELINSMIASKREKIDNEDYGWYMQLVANYLFKIDASRSMEQQIIAHENNTEVLKIPTGIRYKKIEKRTGTQANRIFIFAKRFKESNAFLLYVNELLGRLNFGIKADIFEETLKDIAGVIGFESQRPEKEFKKVSDVLWFMSNNQYIIFEAKNEVYESRKYIYKEEAEQITNSFNWFRNDEYVGEIGYPVLIHPSNMCNNDAFPDENTLIMDKEKLDLFTNNIRSFVIELSNKFIDLTPSEVAESLNRYNLNDRNIVEKYTKKFIKKTMTTSNNS